jgi:hypothetical protein
MLPLARVADPAFPCLGATTWPGQSQIGDHPPFGRACAANPACRRRHRLAELIAQITVPAGLAALRGFEAD